MEAHESGKDRLAEAREVLRAARREAELIAANPEILAGYAGQWVVIQDGRVVAHAADGTEPAIIASIDEFPDAVVEYVPSLEEQEGILILRSHLAEDLSS